MTTETLVIGIGNEWRGDDGVGPYIAKIIWEQHWPNTRVIANVADGLDLLDTWRDADTVYVIDALRGCGDAGSVIRVDALSEALPTEAGYSSHTFGLAEAIELGRTLNALPKQLIVIGIEGHDFAMGNGLTAAVENAAQQIIAQLRAEISALKSQEIRHA